MAWWIWILGIIVILIILAKIFKKAAPYILGSIPLVGGLYGALRYLKADPEEKQYEMKMALFSAAGCGGLARFVMHKKEGEGEAGVDAIGAALVEAQEARTEHEDARARREEQLELLERREDALGVEAEAGAVVPPVAPVAEGEVEEASPRRAKGHFGSKIKSSWGNFKRKREERKLRKAEDALADPDAALIPSPTHQTFVWFLSFALQGFYFMAGLSSSAWGPTLLLMAMVSTIIWLIDRKVYGWYQAIKWTPGRIAGVVIGLGIITMIISISLNPLIAADFDATMDQIKAVPGHIGDGIVDSWYYVKAKILPPTVAGVAITSSMDFEACYPFCVTEGGSKKEIWQGFEITTLKMIPISVYDYQPFSVVTEFQNKGVGDTTFELPLSSLGAQTVIEFQGEVINCDIFALLRKTIQDVAGELSGEYYYNTNLCLYSSPLAQEGSGTVTPVVTGACRSQIFDDDGYPIALDGGEEVSVSYSGSTVSYSGTTLTLPENHHLGFDFSGEVMVMEDETGTNSSTHSISSDYGLIQKIECTLKPQDITQIRWYGMQIGGANLGVGDVQQPDIMLTVNYTFLPKTDLVGTLVIQDVQTQVTATSAEQKIVNKISKSYSPAGPLMLAFGTAEDQIIANTPTLFLIQLRNKGSGIVQEIEPDNMVIYIPIDFTLARSGTTFCDFNETDADDLKSYFREGFENNNDGTLTDPTSGTIYRTYIPGTKAARTSLTGIEAGSNVLKNPPFGCLLKAPKLAEGREFETYDFRVRLKEYIYQESGVEKITIYGTCADACGTATACSCDDFYESGMDTINDYFNATTGVWTTLTE